MNTIKAEARRFQFFDPAALVALRDWPLMAAVLISFHSDLNFEFMKTTVINSSAIANNGSVDNKANGLAGGAAAASNGGSAIVPNKDFDKPSGNGKTAVKAGEGAKVETLKAKMDAEKGETGAGEKEGG